ncbi:hypothetical protein B0T26DRAFT_660141 [Lasiosphaeria miniovina]|uniref:Plasma membrane proteolipid 3 n=1 Tax=Lasiosphaeria miniovina TaxID=1954250 RepID=A0AA40DG05_9PEZI|nr:uncharacterized protein B0T26DRAFT_660141 [Lasiosphaeria miniovina]KAK0702079.1 hypothetical protein B0T26DRAFT_660141 [Lasiosphaeria miniovina]
MAHNHSTVSDLVLYILAFFIPPLAVFFRTGCDADFLINICLTILAWFPGVIHAFWIIHRTKRAVVVPAIGGHKGPVTGHHY